jgi:hypothetical protein
MQRQNKLTADAVENPLTDLDLSPHDTTVLSVVLSLNMSLFKQMKPPLPLLVSERQGITKPNGSDVRLRK